MLFRTQEFELSVPEIGDAYGVLKYLATVTPAFGRAPVAPVDDESCQVVVSATPRKRLPRLADQRILVPGAPPFIDAPIEDHATIN